MPIQRLDPRCLDDHGRPAPALGLRGMPAYDHEDGELTVHTFLVAQLQGSGGLMLFPRDYGITSLVAPDGMASLHHNVDAWWAWRPILHRWAIFHDGYVGGHWEALGSQTELAWRHGLMRVQHAIHGGDFETVEEVREEMAGDQRAEARAERLLLSCLSPTQRLDWAALGSFRVRGAATGHVYKIDYADGFDRIDPVSGDTLVSYCLHTEHWLPHSDLALATKFGLEDAGLEPEILEGARGVKRPRPLPPATEMRIAEQIEERWRLLDVGPRELVRE